MDDAAYVSSLRENRSIRSGSWQKRAANLGGGHSRIWFYPSLLAKLEHIVFDAALGGGSNSRATLITSGAN